MTFLDIVITLVMLKSFTSCSQSHGFILHSEIPWLRLTIQKQKWDYSTFCPCQSQGVWLSSCRPQSRLQGTIVRWHYCPTNTAKSQLFYITKKQLMHYLTQGSGVISGRILSSKMDGCCQESWVTLRRLWSTVTGMLHSHTHTVTLEKIFERFVRHNIDSFSSFKNWTLNYYYKPLFYGRVKMMWGSGEERKHWEKSCTIKCLL